jgi:hypothetical protein
MVRTKRETESLLWDDLLCIAFTTFLHIRTGGHTVLWLSSLLLPPVLLLLAAAWPGVKPRD